MPATAVSVLLRTLLLLFSAIGVSHALFRRKGGFMNAGGILYYTIQSNLWVFVVTAVSLALSLARPGGFSCRALELARFAVAVGITLTFLVFWLALAPKLEREYLLSLNNILVHTLVPLLFVADFFLLEPVSPLRKADVLWSAALPLYYFVFTLLHAKLNPSLNFPGDSRYPYYFLDVDKLGWFRLRHAPGVFWWVLLLFCITLGLGFFYRWLVAVV